MWHTATYCTTPWHTVAHCQRLVLVRYSQPTTDYNQHPADMWLGISTPLLPNLTVLYPFLGLLWPRSKVLGAFQAQNIKIWLKPG
mmetsp:Transcript_78130/g.137908  ORF Transcript_78130/g.137908 Transcript_78130/m.137908 type:complete len:85 (-) Transcript_78130:234-488(-)